MSDSLTILLLKSFFEPFFTPNSHRNIFKKSLSGTRGNYLVPALLPQAVRSVAAAILSCHMDIIVTPTAFQYDI
jgi:hypothetical protein